MSPRKIRDFGSVKTEKGRVSLGCPTLVFHQQPKSEVTKHVLCARLMSLVKHNIRLLADEVGFFYIQDQKRSQPNLPVI